MPGNDIGNILGAAFLGYVVGCTLYGGTVLQTWQYFRTYRLSDSLYLRTAVVFLFFAETLHFGFSTHVFYYYLIQHYGDMNDLLNAPVIWTFKAFAISTVLIIWIVQSLYLIRIWKLAKNPLIISKLNILRTFFVVIVFVAASVYGVGSFFIAEVTHIPSLRLLPDFNWIIYIAQGTIAIVDISISATMIFLLQQGFSGIRRTDNVISTIIQYTMASGILTSLAAVAYIVLCVVQRKSSLNLAIPFAIPRLYSNSYLALCNSREFLRNEMNATISLNFRELWSSKSDTAGTSDSEIA